MHARTRDLALERLPAVRRFACQIVTHQISVALLHPHAPLHLSQVALDPDRQLVGRGDALRGGDRL
ncbi:MAG: hypothetical protein IIC91_11815 [Chloroflexi bacterium]|nr:hypothetical protein [Chloroflexota bacterium]